MQNEDEVGSTSGSSDPEWVQRRFGAAFWLGALNAIAIGVVAAMVAVALRAAARPAAQPAFALLTLLAQSPGAMGVAFAFASAVGLWLGLRRTPWGRAIGLSLAPGRVAPRR